LFSIRHCLRLSDVAMTEILSLLRSVKRLASAGLLAFLVVVAVDFGFVTNSPLEIQTPVSLLAYDVSICRLVELLFRVP
jgi:hypothetical protein